MKKITFFDVQDSEKNFLENSCNGRYDYVFISEPLTENYKLDDNISNCEILSCFTSSRVTKEVLKKFKNLKLIALRSVGFNHIDLDYCKDNKIVIVNAPNYGNKSVAEFAFGLMLDVARNITKAHIQLLEGNSNESTTVGFELHNKTIGIVGLGAIGAEMAKLAYGFDMKILGYDKYEKEHLKTDYNVEYTSFENLIKNSDVISLHVPLTKENTHLFNEQIFKMMKKTAVIINTARGALIDTQALYNALVSKEIQGAGLDVLECEEAVHNPDYFMDISALSKNYLKKTLLNSRLMKLDNVVVTPHIAYDTREAIKRILNITMDNIEAFCSNNIKNNVC